MPCACGFVLLPPPILIGVVVVVVVVSSIQSGVFFVSSLLSLFFLLLLVSVLKKFCHACFFCLSCVCFLSLFSSLLSVKIRLSFCIKKSKARRQLKNLSRLSSKILAATHHRLTTFIVFVVRRRLERWWSFYDVREMR